MSIRLSELYASFTAIIHSQPVQTQLQDRWQIVSKDRQQSLPQAAVLMAITREEVPSIILTQRSMMLSTHKGQVALPGGMRDPEDQNLLQTALRECEEEVGISADFVEPICKLYPLISRHNVCVTPYIGFIPSNCTMKLNLDEIDSAFKVPISYLYANRHAVDRDEFTWEAQRVSVGRYPFDQYLIWGLTAALIEQLLDYVDWIIHREALDRSQEQSQLPA